MRGQCRVWLWGKPLPTQMWGAWQGWCWPCQQGWWRARSRASLPPGALALELLVGNRLSSIFELGVGGTQGWLLGTAS